MKKLRPVVLLPMVLALAACGPPAAAGPQMIMTGGRIHTRPDGTAIVEALAIEGDFITAVGSDAEIRALATDDTQEMSLDGAVVVPGLHDDWVDLERLGASVSGWVDLRLAASPREVQARLRPALASSDHVIVGWGWDERAWPDPVPPTAEILDELATDRPIVLYRRDGEVAWLNSLALERAGLVERTLGGSGVVAGPDLAFLGSLMPKLDAAIRAEQLRTALQLALEAGLSSIATAPLSTAAARALAGLDATDVPIRVAARLAPGAVAPRNAVARTVTFGAIGLRLDGPLGLALAGLETPHANGTPALPVDVRRLQAACDAAVKAELPLDVHARGDAAVTAALGCTAVRRVVGADVLPEPFPPGLLAVVVPGRLGHDLYWLRDMIGPGRARRAHAYRTMARAGAIAGLASDAPANDLSPPAALAIMLTRRDRAGYPLDGWEPNERLAVGDSLQAMLRAGSVSATLELGRPADLTVWSEDLYAGVDELRRAQALLTIVDGRVVYSRPLVTPPMDRHQ